MSCLQHLFAIRQDVDVYLVDDQSSDGTTEAIAKLYPQITIIAGTGNLFWNRGMYLAWQHASKFDYDFYVWLNDDVLLLPNSFDELFACATLTDNKAIISGLISTAEGTAIIYGGTDKNKQLLSENLKLNAITHMNGNVVLVPKDVFNLLGNLDPFYHHDLGDVDYGLRALKKNIGVFTTRQVIATGDRNDMCRVRLNHSTIKKRFQQLYAPLGSNPRINFYFRKKHYGLLHAMLYNTNLFFINLLPDSFNKLLFGKKYS
jgi:GT2 family glycosyltransferase